MDPDKVLNEEERKKYTHPKKRPRLQNSRTSVPEASTSQSIIELEPQETDEPELIIDEVEHEVAKVEAPLEPLASSSRKSIAARVNEIQNSFMLAYNDLYDNNLEFNQNQEQIQRFLKAHQNKEDWSSQHSLILKSIIDQTIPWIHKAAKTVTSFFELCSEDKKLLLAKNSVLIYEYIFARYFTSDTGMEQVYWAFGPSDVIKIGNVYSNGISKIILKINTFAEVDALAKLALIDFDLANQEEGIFISFSNLAGISTYKSCLSTIKKHFHYPPFYTPLLAHFFIFSINQWTVEDKAQLTNPDLISSFEKSAIEMIQFGNDAQLSLGTQYLTQLAETLATMSRTKNITSIPMQMHEEAQYSVGNEAQWLNEKVEMYFCDIANDIKPDQEVIERIIAHQLGAGHLRKQVLYEGFQLQHKRFMRLMQRGFGISRIKLSTRNLDLCTILLGIKFDNCTNLIECIKGYTALENLGHFEDLYRSVPNKSLLYDPNFCTLIEPETLGRARTLSFSLGRFLNRRDIFFLTMMIFLLHGEDEYSAWRESFRRLLMKRLNDYLVIKGVNDVQVIFDQFANDFAEYIRLVPEVIREGNAKVISC